MKKVSGLWTVAFAAFASLAMGACSLGSPDAQRSSVDQLFAHQDSVLGTASQFSDTIVIKYARGLSVSYQADGVLVTISNPAPSVRHAQTMQFLVSAPSSRFVCTTALQLGNFEALGLEDKIVGINSLRNLFSPKVREQIESGHTIMIGKEGNFDVEAVMAQQPDFIFVSASKHGGFEALRDCGIPLIPHHGYKETDPLGQAEWIKLVGLLTGQMRRANAVFSDIERKYCALRDQVALIDSAQFPSVFSGRQLRDGWYAVGGQSYLARIFADAGARYLLADNQESGGVTMDFEAAYARGVHAQFWQIDGAAADSFSLASLAAEDSRYATMDAYAGHKVLFCNLSQTPYRELAGVQPHLLLADFVKAFHPEVLPLYVPTYYSLLD